MPSVLHKIVETKRRELETERAAVPQGGPIASARAAPPPFWWASRSSVRRTWRRRSPAC